MNTDLVGEAFISKTDRDWRNHQPRPHSRNHRTRPPTSSSPDPQGPGKDSTRGVYSDLQHSWTNRSLQCQATLVWMQPREGENENDRR